MQTYDCWSSRLIDPIVPCLAIAMAELADCWQNELNELRRETDRHELLNAGELQLDSNTKPTIRTIQRRYRYSCRTKGNSIYYEMASVSF